jgi:hypothetical protein
LGTLCIYWAVSIIILILMQRGQMNYALLLTLPGYLLLALFANRVLGKGVDGLAWALAGGILLVGMLVFVNVARYSRSIIFEPEKFDNIWIAFFTFTIALISLYFIGTWHFRASNQGAFLGILAFFLFYQWGTGWWLSHDAANEPRERWVSSGTDDDVRLMVDIVTDISQEKTGTDFGIDIFSGVDTPVLRWYLRDFDQLQVGDTLPVEAQYSVIISQPAADLVLGSDYLGADFGLILNEDRPFGSNEEDTSLETLRWWLFHEPLNALSEERIILWWRSDLVGTEN